MSVAVNIFGTLTAATSGLLTAGSVGVDRYTTGARPAASSLNAGMIIVNTTTGGIQWSDGSLWNDAASGASTLADMYDAGVDTDSSVLTITDDLGPLNLKHDDIRLTDYVGLLLQNTTPSSGSIQRQYSPQILLEGRKWQSSGSIDHSCAIAISNAAGAHDTPVTGKPTLRFQTVIDGTYDFAPMLDIYEDGTSLILSPTNLGALGFAGNLTMSGGNILNAADINNDIGTKTARWNSTYTKYLGGGSSNTVGHLVPNVADDTIALLAATQTLTNKTISGATNTITNVPASAFSTPLFVSLVDVGVAAQPAATVGNFTTGRPYTWSTTCTITGVRIYWGSALSKTIKCQLWDPASASQKTVNISVAGIGAYTGTFSSSYSLAAANVGKQFVLSMYETTGGLYQEGRPSGVTLAEPTAPWQAGFYLTINASPNLWVAGDAIPASAASTTSWHYIEPIFTVP